MKTLKYLLLLSIVIALTSCDDGTIDEIKAKITAEDFVKQEMLSPDDLEFKASSVKEVYLNRYVVNAKIKALNAFGMKIPKQVKVDLEYMSGDWEDLSSWKLWEISYDGVTTTQTETANKKDNGWDAFNDAKDGETAIIGGIKFRLMFNNQYTANLASEKKLTKKQIQKVCKDKKWKNKDLYFYEEGNTESLAGCYANYIGGYLTYF